ncbi:MAG: hypothetical protein AB7T10_05015 [bacterium]
MNIELKSIDKIKTFNPDKNYALYNVYIELTETPDQIWMEIFKIIWSQIWYSMKRKAWIENNYLIIHSPLDEIEKYHIQFLKKAIELTNKERNEQDKRNQINQERQKQEKIDEDKEKDKYLGKLKL